MLSEKIVEEIVKAEEVKPKTIRKVDERNESRRVKRLHKNGAALIKAALNNGCTSRAEISKTTGLNTGLIRRIFDKDTELWAIYKIAAKGILDRAYDNISKIIADPKHPQNFQASKFILTKYKSELDALLDPHKTLGGGSININGNTTAPITINFKAEPVEKTEDVEYIDAELEKLN